MSKSIVSNVLDKRASLTQQFEEVVKSVQEAADRSYTYVLVTTKALPDINPTPQIIAPLLTPEYAEQYAPPTFVILQNGLGVERDLYTAAQTAWTNSDPKILSAAVYIQANLIGDRDIVEQGPFVSFPSIVLS